MFKEDYNDAGTLINDIFWSFQPDNILISASNAFCEMLGYSRPELISKNLNVILTPDSLKSISKSIKVFTQGGKNENYTGYAEGIGVEYISKNGKIIPSEVVLFPLLDSSEKVTNILSVSNNLFHKHLHSKNFEIDKLKKELKNLNEEYSLLVKELEERNHHILEYNYELTKSVNEKMLVLSKLEEAQRNARIGSWEWNIPTGEMWWSEELYNIFEVDPEQYVPTLEDNPKFIHPDDRELYNNVINKCLNTGELLNVDFRIITRNGKIKYCTATGKVTYNYDDKPAHFTGTFMDITERKQAEESLVKLTEAIKYLIAQTSLKYGIEFFNATVLALCKTLDASFCHIGILQPDKEHIKTIAFCNQHVILPSIEYQVIGTPCETVINKLTMSYQKDVSVLFPDERLLKDMHIEGYVGVPLFYKSGEPLGLIACLYTHPVEDVAFSQTIIKLFTDRAANEYERFLEKEQLEQALKKAEESDRLKSMFLQNMSHEIRTPMNAIMGFAELLTKAFNNKDKLSQFSQIIQRRSKDLLDLINDILDLSRIESGKQNINLEIYDVNRLFYELDEMFLVYQKKKEKSNIKLTFHYLEPSKSIIITDVGKLRQILVNLITNAFKFTESGTIKVGCNMDVSSNLQFYVEDTGMGIPPDKLEIIFNRFMQISNGSGNSAGGTGLGLAIVKGLVELLEGEIWVESKEGVGSKFMFSIKYQSASGIEDTHNLRQQLDFSLFKDKTLLLVEDDIYSVIYTVELLSGSGFNVHHESSGKAAMDFVRNNPVDVVLLDIRIPELDGYEVARQIKQNFPHIKVIAQTAYAMQEDRLKALEAGCDDYLSKPLEKTQLFNIIQDQLAHT